MTNASQEPNNKITELQAKIELLEKENETLKAINGHHIKTILWLAQYSVVLTGVLDAADVSCVPMDYLKLLDDTRSDIFADDDCRLAIREAAQIAIDASLF